MSTEERDESQPRPRKVIPSIRRENTDQDSERRPYNQGYNRPEGNNYERRPYNRGGYNSYGDNRSYGDRPSRPNRITAIMVETVATATLIVKAAITADLLTVAIALMVTTIALLTAMTVLMGTIVRTIVRLARTMKTEERLIRLLRPAKVFRVMV